MSVPMVSKISTNMKASMMMTKLADLSRANPTDSEPFSVHSAGVKRAQKMVVKSLKEVVKVLKEKWGRREKQPISGSMT